MTTSNDPSTNSSERTCAQMLVDALRAQGVDRVFCVPGESYLPVLDALYDSPEIEVVNARHEGAAANMAEADGKLTQRPGVCFVTRGPGATHASIGVHTAQQDSTPMILFIGQVALAHRERDGFQEIDYRAMFGTLCKWVTEIEDPRRTAEIVSRAFHVARSGRQGPVVIALPEDMLGQAADIAASAPAVIAQAAPAPAMLKALRQELEGASKPLVIVGGSGWTEEGARELAAFAAAWSLPVIASFRRQDVIDNEHPSYIGHAGLGIDPKLAARIRQADLIVALGARLGENMTSGYTLLSSPTPQQRLVHIYPDPQEIGRVFAPVLAACCSGNDMAIALAGLRPEAPTAWGKWLEEGRRDFEHFSSAAAVGESARGVDMTKVVAGLRERLAPDAIITNGAGNYTVWLHRFYRYRGLRTELAPISGAMGYGLPAAIAAKLRHPDRDVVCFAGDGCFLMYPQELATAAQAKANIIVLLVNNGMYGTIRMHQERHFPGRVIATKLENPDFIGLAQSFHIYAERVVVTAQFDAAFDRARKAGRLALLELCVDPDQITPTMRL